MKKHIKYLLIIFLLSIISMMPMLSETHILGHDTNFHVANINAIHESIDEHFIPSKILDKVGNNFGYATNIFYPPLPHTSTAYLTKLTSPFGFDTLDTLAVVYFLITFISAIEVYFLAEKISHKKIVALTSSIIFLLMPYRLGDMIVRGALNECFTFLFIPLVLLSLFNLIDDKPKAFFLQFVIGYTGLFYSHLVITLYFTLFLMPFILIYFKKLWQKENRKLAITAIITVTLFILPILVPLLEHKIMGNYLVFAENYLSGLNFLQAYNNTLLEYIQVLDDYSWAVPKFINMLVILLFVISTILLIKDKKKEKKITFLYWFSFLAFFLSLNIFPWQWMPEFMYMIQFAWRTETMLVISLSVLAPLCLTYLTKDKVQLYTSIITIAAIVLTTIPFLEKLSTHTYLTESDVNPNLAMGHQQEYLPVNTYNNIDYFNNRGHEIKKTNGNCDIQILSDKIPELSFEVSNANGNVTIELPRLFYFGYHLTGEKGTYTLSLQENENGFLEATIRGNGTYHLTYTGTILDKIANILSLGGFILVGITLFKLRKRTTNMKCTP